MRGQTACVHVCSDAVFVVLACLLAVHSTAWAQATIAGVVRDASGAVLPGVTVEAASPALIEKVRTAVTDGAGRYRIENLRPGTYTRDLHAAGLRHREARGPDRQRHGGHRRRRRLRVGGVQETITVTGETPVVDVQSTRREITLDNETHAEPAERPQLQLPARPPCPGCRPTTTTSTPVRCSRSSRSTAAAASSRA